MATSLSSSSQSQSRARTLNDLQAMTGLNIEDAIHFLDHYDWKLNDITEDYYYGIDLSRKSTENPSLGRFYTNNNQTQQPDEDSDRHYAQLLHLYGDVDEWVRNECQQKSQSSKNTKAQPIYHEKQRLMMCGLHSLNNLFQSPKLFTRHSLEEIVRDFDKRKLFNDYRTLWLGNYDLRVLIEAINRYGFSVRQIDLYNGESLNDVPWESYFGLLINLNGTHWFTVKNLNGIYYNLDSTLRKPIQIGKRKDLIRYLTRLIQATRQVHIFVVSEHADKSILF